MNAVRVAWSAGPLVLGLWVVELVVAACAGGSVRAMSRMVMQEFALPPDGRLLYGLAEIGELDPSLRAGVGAALLASTAIGMVVWAVASPLLIAWLHGPRDEVATRWAKTIVPTIATTAWHVLLRIAVFFAIATTTSSLPRWVAGTALVVAIAICGAALDVARVQVVAFGASGTALRTALSAFLAVLRRPRVLGALAGMHLLQWAVAGCVLAITLRSGGALPWVGRGLALVGTALAAVRLAVALRMGPLGLDRRPGAAAPEGARIAAEIGPAGA